MLTFQPSRLFRSYYNTPGVRETCHAVKEYGPDYREAIKEMADFFATTYPVNADSVIVPVPQHTGRAEYTLDIANLVADSIGCRVADIVACTPHDSFHSRKLENLPLPEFDFFLVEDIPDGDIFILDNMISSGETFFRIRELLARPAMPMVFGLSDGRFDRWDELEEAVMEFYSS